jgi:hypothetical protein
MSLDSSSAIGGHMTAENARRTFFLLLSAGLQYFHAGSFDLATTSDG